jgi:GntR family galactonate operon transcriptional repressor
MIIPGSGYMPSHLPERAKEVRRMADNTAEPRRKAGAGLVVPRSSRGVAEDIAGYIRSGRLPAGSTLPTYHALAQRYHVSVTPVQHAIALLNARGLTRGQRRRGVHVLGNEDLVNGRGRRVGVRHGGRAPAAP